MNTFIQRVILIAFIGCLCQCTDDTPPTCGCESETLYPIPHQEFEDVYGIPLEEQMQGKLFYKHPEVIDGFYDYEEYNNMFWILQDQRGCGNCRRVFMVCNEELVGQEFQYLKQQGVYDSIPVQFSGDVKLTCIVRYLPADMVYGRIELNTLKNY
jgi:hypothetical protein